MQNRTFRIFKYRNFRLFFSGLIISQIGIWIQNVAVNWLIYDLTKSPFLMGLSLFLSFLPFIFFTPIAGAIIDKFNKHKLLILIQILLLVQSFLLLILYIKKLSVVNIVLLTFFLNILLSIDAPLRQSLFVCLIKNRNELTNAISINSSCFNTVKILGPSISGLIIVNFGYKICFLLTLLCIIPNIILVSMMRIKECGENLKNNIFNDLIEGLKYIFKTNKILYLQLFLGIFCFLIMIYPMFMPIYVKSVFFENADTLGFLMGMIGFGALVSSLLIASKKDDKNLKNIMISANIFLGICFILFAFVKNIKLAVLVAFLTGLCVTGFITPQISILQRLIDDKLRGRVMSLNSFCILGIPAISTVISGFIIDKLGILNTFILYGMILISFTIFFAFKIQEN